MRKLINPFVLFFVLSLSFTNSPNVSALGADDPILQQIALWIGKVIDTVKTVGESFLAELRVKGVMAQLSSKKAQATTESNVHKALSKQEMELEGIKNTGNMGRVMSVRTGPDGRIIREFFWVSAIAPSGCMSQKKADVLKSFFETEEEFKEHLKAINSEFFSLRTIVDAVDNIRSINSNIDRILFDNRDKNLSAFPSSDKTVSNDTASFKLISAYANKFVNSKKPLLDLKNMDQDTLRGMIQYADGQKWITNQFTNGFLRDLIADSFSGNITLNDSRRLNTDNNKSTSVPFTKSLESLKDFYYATSFKRTLSTQVKFEAGNLMEMNYLLSRIVTSRLEEYEMLKNENKLLIIQAMQRIKEYRKEF